ncbi:TIM barrel protein [Ensifer sp. SSB1]|uniref:hydroxypyruvate isomerase family protein n=1 Tax=Ensifer sp. SSB1 TaxID=2795385 RepID=UPI0025BAEC68|nr:TIM barrel protein [Ensifer sp. SSB1]
MTAQPIFSAHTGYLFKELPFEERFEAAAAVGFDAVEHPYLETFEPAVIRGLLKKHRLRFAQLSCAFGDLAMGEKGLAALPGRQSEFRATFDSALEFALAVDAPYVHPMAGVPPQGSDADAGSVYLENLHYAVQRTAGTPAKILIEAISERSVPGYALSTLEQACRVQDVFGPGNLSLLFDTFHARATGIDPAQWVAENAYRIGHIHIADHPGRQEPGTGTLDFEPVLSALQAQSFQGAIGFEFTPSANTVESLTFLAAWRARSEIRRRA